MEDKQIILTYENATHIGYSAIIVGGLSSNYMRGTFFYGDE